MIRERVVAVMEIGCDMRRCRQRVRLPRPIKSYQLYIRELRWLAYSQGWCEIAGHTYPALNSTFECFECLHYCPEHTEAGIAEKSDQCFVVFAHGEVTDQ